MSAQVERDVSMAFGQKLMLRQTGQRIQFPCINADSFLYRQERPKLKGFC